MLRDWGGGRPAAQIAQPQQKHRAVGTEQGGFSLKAAVRHPADQPTGRDCGDGFPVADRERLPIDKGGTRAGGSGLLRQQTGEQHRRIPAQERHVQFVGGHGEKVIGLEHASLTGGQIIGHGPMAVRPAVGVADSRIEGTAQHGQVLSPGERPGGLHSAIRHPAEDPQLTGAYQRVIGPVGLIQVGIICGQGGDGEREREQQRQKESGGLFHGGGTFLFHWCCVRGGEKRGPCGEHGPLRP